MGDETDRTAGEFTRIAVVDGEAGLTEREARLIDIVATTDDLDEIQERAGYGESALLSGAFRRKVVQGASRDRAHGRLKVVGVQKAYRAMMDLMGPKTPPATRFAAAKWVMEASGIGPATADPSGDKPLAEMTAKELEAFIKQLEGPKEPPGRIVPLKTVVEAVTLDNGALPTVAPAEE